MHTPFSRLNYQLPEESILSQLRDGSQTYVKCLLVVAGFSRYPVVMRNFWKDLKYDIEEYPQSEGKVYQRRRSRRIWCS
jgi:hypothetical protein